MVVDRVLHHLRALETVAPLVAEQRKLLERQPCRACEVSMANELGGRLECVCVCVCWGVGDVNWSRDARARHDSVILPMPMVNDSIARHHAIGTGSVLSGVANDLADRLKPPMLNFP